MTTSTSRTVVYLVAMALFAGIIAFALYAKGNVKASARIGPGSFIIEASEKQK